MKISYSWLQQFLKVDLEAEKTAELLTDLGLEVEGLEKVESIKGSLKGLVVGFVLTCEQHPNADRLKVTTVDIGVEFPLQIVCGAPNVEVGQKVPVALIGTTLYDENGASFKIKKGKIRGQESYGMICAEDELGLGSSHAGIMVLDKAVEIGTPLAKVFNIQEDYVFEIGLTPNRADAMSHFGVARDLRAGLIQQGLSLELITPSVSDFHVEDRTLKIDIEIVDTVKAPRYSGVTISEVTVKDSPEWLQTKLKAIGIKPTNNIVDVTNYVMHEIGQPLHAFDAAQIKGNKVIVKTLTKGTKFTTLDNVERALHEDDLMICNGKEEPMCIAGVLGGLETGVTQNTRTVFLESAYFNPVAIRKTAKRHALNTDASFRFERGIDPNLVEYALKRAAVLIIKVAGGKISSEITDIYPEKIRDFEVFLSYEKMDKLIGEKLDRGTVKNILSSLEMKINNITDAGIGLTIPAYRVDVQREADLIEEILRVYGYNNITTSNKLNTSIAASKFDVTKLENSIATQLNALGFHEMMANSLTKPSYIAFSEKLDEAHNVTMLNPLSADLSVMRQSLLFSGLESVAYNINRKNNNLQLFEFGKTYHKYISYQEQKHLSLLVTGNRTKDYWNQATNTFDYFYFKGVIKTILERLGHSKLKAKPIKDDVFSEGLAFYLGKRCLVEFGVVKKAVLKSFGIKQEVLYADFNWSSILEVTKSKKFKVVTMPKFPAVKRDLSLLIDDKITFKEIYDLAFQSEKSLLKAVDLFDVYQGEKLPENKKSYAVSFILQDENKTLNDKTIDKVMKKLQAAFTKQLHAELR